MSYDISSGVVSSNVILESGTMNVLNGGIVSNTTAGDRGWMYIKTGGFAADTTINRNGVAFVSSGAAANGVVLNDWGMMFVSNGGIADDVTLNKGAMVTVFGGAAVNGATVNSDADLKISAGASVNDLNIADGGRVAIELTADTKVNGIYNSAAFDVADGYTVNSGSILDVMSTGAAADTTVNDGGIVRVFDGGSVNGITVNAGNLYVSNGGIATNVIWTPCVGNIFVDAGASVTYKNTYTGVYFGSANQLISSAMIMNSKTVTGSMYVMNKGAADFTTVNNGGRVFVSNGGIAGSTAIGAQGTVYVYDGGTANTTVIDSRGYLYVEDGGYASGVTVNSKGNLWIYGGGSASDVTVKDGGVFGLTVAPDTFVNGTVNGTEFAVQGAAVTGYTVNAGNYLYVENGGTAYSANVAQNGIVRVSSGGIANGTNVEGFLHLENGAVHRGSLQIGADAVVSAYSGSTIDFMIADRGTEDDYMINDLSLIKGAPEYTITIFAEQSFGTYKLAQGASGLTGSISICTYGGTCFGDIVVNGDALIVDDIHYYLKNDAGDLTLTVSDASIAFSDPVYIAGTFNGKGGIFELNSFGEGIIHTGDGNVQLGTIDTDTWELLEAGDFNRSGSDGLLWLEKATGYVYAQNDLSSFDEVTNKSNCLGVLGEGYSILASGDFTGTGFDGVLMQGPAFGDASVSLNYGLPVWGREIDGTTFVGWLGALVNTWQPGDALKGDTSDLADINAKNYMYEVVAAGDFNGDGVDDVMLQNIMPTSVNGVKITGSGDVFTFLTGDIDAVKAGANPTVAYSGCATDGWEIVGVGDFNNDGIDDVLLSDGTGVAGWQMANGQRSSDMWFGNLSANDEIIGVADVDNDGTDDILIRNAVTEEFSAWKVQNGTVTGSIAIA